VQSKVSSQSKMTTASKNSYYDGTFALVSPVTFHNASIFDSRFDALGNHSEAGSD